MELRKIRNGESNAKPGKELSKEETHFCNDSHSTFHDQRLYKGEKTQQDHDTTDSISDGNKAQKNWHRKCSQKEENEPYESSMTCWEILDDLEQASKKRKTHGQDAATNDDKEIQSDEMDNKMHNKHTTSMGKCLNIPVGELKLEVDDNASMLATQETSAKNLVFIMNIPESTLDVVKNVRDSSMNTSKQDDKKISPLKKSNPITSNDNLNAYGESGRDDNPEKRKEQKKKTKNG